MKKSVLALALLIGGVPVWALAQGSGSTRPPVGSGGGYRSPFNVTRSVTGSIAEVSPQELTLIIQEKNGTRHTFKLDPGTRYSGESKALAALQERMAKDADTMTDKMAKGDDKKMADEKMAEGAGKKMDDEKMGDRVMKDDKMATGDDKKMAKPGLTLRDFRPGHIVKVTYRASDHIALEVRLREVL